MAHSTFTRYNGTRLAINFLNNIQWLILSKALLASKNATYTEVERLLKYSMNSVSAYLYT